MRKQFIEVSTIEEAEKLATWACALINADGGYWCFESAHDAEVFLGQE